MRPTIAGLALATVALLSAGLASVAQTKSDASAPTGANVSVTITIIDTETSNGSTRRAYRLVARDGGGPASLLMGWRMPVPVSRGSDETGEPGGMKFVYQNIGVSAQLEAQRQGDGRIRVHGQIEASAPRDPAKMPGAPPGMPIIGTFQQAVDVVLVPGKALAVAEVPDPEGGDIRLELQADPLP